VKTNSRGNARKAEERRICWALNRDRHGVHLANRRMSSSVRVRGILKGHRRPSEWDDGEHSVWGWATLSAKVSGGASDQTTLSPCLSLDFVVSLCPRLAYGRYASAHLQKIYVASLVLMITKIAKRQAKRKINEQGRADWATARATSPSTTTTSLLARFISFSLRLPILEHSASLVIPLHLRALRDYQDISESADSKRR
jgi:hypothetical protein